MASEEDIRIEQEGYDEALRRIKAARESGTTKLDLSGLGLADVPPEIGQLTALQTLVLYGNQLTTLPEAVGKLTALQTLNLGGNQLTTLPEAVEKLTALQTLVLNGNQLTTLPEAVEKLTALQTLYLYGNQLTTLPEAVGKLTALQTLDLDRNQLTTLPEAVGKLTALQMLDLSGNQLTTLPESLRECARLEGLFLHGNDGLGLSPEVLGPKWEESTLARPNGKAPARPADILKYYFSLRAARAKGKTRRLNEAKLVVVGPEAVGKTSLVRYLIDNKPRDPDERKTPGLATRERIDVRQLAPDDTSGLRLNVWDFGGQEIMYETHQYFLRERCLYVLVLEARREDDSSLHYWMKTIRNRAGADAPVIVVVNKYEPPEQIDKIDDTHQQNTYKNIRKIVRTSCNPGHDADMVKLRSLIVGLLNNDPQLKHVRDEFREEFFTVKERLSEEARRTQIVDVGYYQRICEEVGVVTEDEQWSLLDLLDAIGVVVTHHKGDAPEAFRHAALLNPNWVTQAIYDLLIDDSIGKNNAELDIEQLGSHLREPEKYPKKHWGLILEMMEHFNLCFELHGAKKGRYLIPAQLASHEPLHGFLEAGALRFQFNYDLVPPWLVPRLVVEARENLGAKRVAWRNGAIFHAEGCEVLVRAESNERRVRIFVHGEEPRRRAALSIVRNYLAVVHRVNPGIAPRAKIPLPDNPDAPPVDYEYVCELERDEGPHYAWRPPRAARKYSVRELLDCIEEPESRQSDEEADGVKGRRRGTMDGSIKIDAREGSHVTVAVGGQGARVAVQNNLEGAEKRGEIVKPKNETATSLSAVHLAMARPVYMLIVSVFGLLALACIGGGIYAVYRNAQSASEFSLFGAQLSTRSAGVAFVGIGLLVAYFTMRSVLRNMRDLAALPGDGKRRRGKDD